MLEVGIPAGFLDLNWDTFPFNQKVVQEVKRYCALLRKQPCKFGAYIWGNKGTGRTFLGTAILKQAMLCGKSARYMTNDYLVDLAFSAERRVEFEELMIEQDVLLIDNLDWPSAKGEGYFRFLQRVMQLRADNHLPLVLISLMAPPQFEDKYGQVSGNLLQRTSYAIDTKMQSADDIARKQKERNELLQLL